MSEPGAWELQEGIYAVFAGDSQLAALVSAEYDFVPEDAVFPYIVIGNVRSRDNSVKDLSMFEHLITIHAFSRGKGKKEANSVVGRVYELLHNTQIAVSGGSLVNMRFISSDIMNEDDGVTYHGVAMFRAVVSG